MAQYRVMLEIFSFEAYNYHLYDDGYMPFILGWIAEELF